MPTSTPETIVERREHLLKAQFQECALYSGAFFVCNYKVCIFHTHVCIAKCVVLKVDEDIVGIRTLVNNVEHMAAYAVGHRDERPWGFYEVINAGFESHQEFCEKRICIFPRQALSLQRHRGRSEIWYVMEGSLMVIVNDKLIGMSAGERIEVPKGAIHCMINLGRRAALVHEKQMGICREDDNDRLADFGNRPTVSVGPHDHVAVKSIDIYESITRFL